MKRSRLLKAWAASAKGRKKRFPYLRHMEAIAGQFNTPVEDYLRAGMPL